MMDAAADHRVERITIEKSARVGGSEVTNNLIGYWIDQDPGPILVVLPSLDLGRKWSKDNFEPMVRDTAILGGRVAEVKSRDKSNTILHKKFPGGSLYIVGANSTSGFRQMTIRYLVKDDLDGYPPVAGPEGDPSELADKRTQTFLNRKIVEISTPTIEGLSRISVSFNESDQRFFYVPCPRCGHFQILIFGPQSRFAHLSKGFLKFDEEGLSWAFYQCEQCNAQLSEADKFSMIRRGEWRSRYPDRRHHAGFHISELYSPWSTWQRIAEGFVKSKKSRERLKVWINTTLGETWVETEIVELKTGDLLKRVEDFQAIPPGVVFCTAGIDVQDDRIECFVEGWGTGEENWILDHFVSYGSPGKPETWDVLNAWILKPRRHFNGYEAAYGTAGGILGVGVDTGGHHTKEAYQFVKRNRSRRYFALKGAGGFGRQFTKISRSRKVPVDLVLVGVDSGKQTIYDRLAINDPGPGYIHFGPVCDENYFLQLTSERRVVKRIHGYPSIAWELMEGRRNEALDAKVYNLAAFVLLNADLDGMRATLDERFREFSDPNKPPVPPDRGPSRPIGRPGRKWITGY